tara:strand:- start:1823 stop:3325 length:1503 start_codon:yes stop_codon:yes gene_type:complete
MSVITSTGTYGRGTTAANALNANLLQYPEIARTLISLYPRYSMTYLLERTRRFAAEKVLGDSSYEWKVMNRLNRKTMIQTVGTNASASAGGALAAGEKATGIKFEASSGGGAEDTLNKFDVIRFPSGGTALVISDPSTNAYELEAITAVTAADNTVGNVVGRIGSAFPYGSTGAEVGENFAYPDTYKNFMTIMRKKCTITGKDATDVTWIENNGQRLWYFTKEQQMMDQFMYEQELQRWYGQTSVATAATNYSATNTDILGEAVTGTYDDGSTRSAYTTTNGGMTIGDGVLEQISSSNQASYSAGTLTEDIITEFIGKISLNAQGAEGNEWVVFTGTEGRIAFHKAMKDMIVAPAGSMTGGSMADIQAGSDISLGGNFTSYYALGNKITIAYCPVFDDPHVHGATAGTNSFGDNRLKESMKMVFMDFGTTSGVSNVELITKGAGGINRSLVKKYIGGMVNPYDTKSMMAANGDDRFQCHVLSESGIIVRNPLSCGILSAS